MIELPLPPKELHAHAKGHWRTKTAATKRCRELARVVAMDCRLEKKYNALMHYRFYFPDRRRRDLANAVHSCKPYIDGIVDAGVIEDDDWTHLSIGSVRGYVDRENPRVEIELIEQGEQ